MENKDHIEFDILEIKHSRLQNTFVFAHDAVCEIRNDLFIEKIVVAADISKATFYLKESLEITDELALEIVEYLYSYLGSMMISLIKNSRMYSTVLLKPTIRVSVMHFVGNERINIRINDYFALSDSIAVNHTLDDENSILKNGFKILNCWIIQLKRINMIFYFCCFREKTRSKNTWLCMPI